jgi:hypothetical protein
MFYVLFTVGKIVPAELSLMTQQAVVEAAELAAVVEAAEVAITYHLVVVIYVRLCRVVLVARLETLVQIV